MGTYIEQNLGKDEKVMLTARIHWTTLLPHILLILLFVGIFTIWGPLIAMFTTELGFTNKKLLGKLGLINTKSLDTPLNKINNVSVTSGLGGKMFGYGTLQITTSSGSYLFKGITGANEFKTALMAQIDTFDEDRIKQQASEMAKAIKS